MASSQVTCADIEQREFIGELALSGELRPVKGVLPAALAAKHVGRSLLVPHDNGDQAALVGKECHQSAKTLLEVCADLLGQQKLGLHQSPPREMVETHSRDLCDIIGQQQGKRALEIAAAGNHNLLFLGPPGTGKTMLASRLCDLLPEMSDAEALETASIASLTQQEITANNWKQRPFRTPHHSSSMAALVGGGTVPRPGEISLAHNGLLFLDELPEFEKKVLDSLRQPLEAGKIVISRAQGKTRFPARFQLVGALNPSPTGYYEDHQSQANPQMVLRYLSRLSGPLLDRFDMSVEIPALPRGTLAQGGDRGESTSTVKQRVMDARQRMCLRGTTNALLTSQQLDEHCPLE